MRAERRDGLGDSQLIFQASDGLHALSKDAIDGTSVLLVANDDPARRMELLFAYGDAVYYSHGSTFTVVSDTAAERASYPEMAWVRPQNRPGTSRGLLVTADPDPILLYSNADATLLALDAVTSEESLVLGTLEGVTPGLFSLTDFFAPPGRLAAIELANHTYKNVNYRRYFVDVTRAGSALVIAP